VMTTAGTHVWLLALRLAQAQAEIKLAQGAYAEAIRFTEDSLARARQSGRVKYEVLGLQTQALARNRARLGALAWRPQRQYPKYDGDKQRGRTYPETRRAVDIQSRTPLRCARGSRWLRCWRWRR
jgi:hypothetical protein